MALTPKTAVLQMRLDPELLRQFQEACAARDETSSAVLRRFIHAEVEGYRIHLAKRRFKLQEAAAAFDRSVEGS